MEVQAITNDYSRWTPNIRVEIWGCPVKVEHPSNCPEPAKHKRCEDDHETCPYWMGYDSSGITVAHWGDVLKGCCGKLLAQKLAEERGK